MRPTPRPKLRWKRWLLGSIAIVVALVVGVPFAYIHFIEGSAPAALTLSSGTSGTTATTSSGNTTGGSASAATSTATSVDGTWTVATGSIAGYRVGETLFGQSATAVGRTTAITGSITLSGTSVTAGSFTADLTKVNSDKSQRDSQFQGRIMDTAKYPTATFTVTGPIQLGTIPADGTTVTKQATGNLTLHGTTKAVTVTVTAKRSGTTIQVAGSIPVIFADYNIPNPTFAGVVTTQDHGTLEFLLDFTQA
jgi:polyisoprenoid-binding protein YceI